MIMALLLVGLMVSQPCLVIVNGYSQTDPYDRYVSLKYHGIEVARLITTLHRNGSVPNTFTWDVNLPFSASNLTASTTNNLWNFSVSNTTGNADVVSLIPLHRVWTLRTITFTIAETGKVYILASGHGICEAADNIPILIDGNQVSTVFNWHPQSLNGGDIPTTPIPYVITYLSVGSHTLEFGSCYGNETTAYILVSAFQILGERFTWN